MSLVEDIFKGGAAGIFSGIGEIIGKFKASPDLALKHAEIIQQVEAEMQKAQLNAEVALSQAQNAVNAIEAGSTDKFTSRWRPYIGWICGTGLGVTLLVAPFFTWISAWIATGKPGPFPTLDTSVLLTTLGGMIGIGGMRTYEKSKGVAK